MKLFRNIRQSFINQGKTTNPAFAKACATAKALDDTRSAGTYLKCAIGEIVLAVTEKSGSCPVRDNILVAGINTKSNPRAFRPAGRYEI